MATITEPDSDDNATKRRQGMPVWSFVTRYPLILVLFVLSVLMSLNDRFFRSAGTMIYLPVLTFGAFAMALFLRHVLYVHTSDQDANDGTFIKEWRELSPERRTTLSVVIVLVLFIGSCLIAAALIK